MLNNIINNNEKTSSETVSPEVILVNFDQNENYPEFFDITLPNIELFKEYDSVEIDIGLQPLTRQLNTKQYSFDPYEAYNQDEKMRYKKIFDPYWIGFALSIWINTAGMVWYAHAHELSKYISFEEIATFAGFFIGSYSLIRPRVAKELIKHTKNKKYAFKDQYFNRELHDEDTFVLEKEHAREQVIWSSRLLPKYMYYDQKSESSSLRMKFLKEQFLNQTWVVNIGSIHIDKAHIEEINKMWMELCVHIKLWKDEKLCTTKEELRQILIKWEPWIISPWLTNSETKSDSPKTIFFKNQCTYSITKTYLGNRRKQYLETENIKWVLISLTSKKTSSLILPAFEQ